MKIERPTFVLKVETDSLHPSCIVCLSLTDPDSGESTTYGGPDEPSILAGIKRAKEADIVVHSQFALDAIAGLYKIRFAPENVLDTLLAARKLTGHARNGLSDWATRFGTNRIPFKGADGWTAEARDHCLFDAYLVSSLYKYLRNLVLEHEPAEGVAA